MRLCFHYLCSSKNYCALISSVVQGRRRCAAVSILGCVCVLCTCVRVPLHLNPSRSPSIPNGTAGEQKLGPSVACAILNQLAALEGLSVITAFSPIHPAEPQPLPLRLHLLVYMMWTNTVYRPFRCAGCIFHHHSSTFTLVICVSHLVADAAGRSTLKVCSLPLVSPLIRRIHLF